MADVAANDYKSWMECAVCCVLCAAEDRGEGVLVMVMDVWWPPFARRAWPTTEEGWKKRTGARRQHVGWMDYGEIFIRDLAIYPVQSNRAPKTQALPTKARG